ARQLMMRRSEVPLSVLARLGLDLLDGLAALHGQRGYRPGGLSATSVLVGQGGQARWIQPFVFGALAHDAVHGRHPDRVAHASPESLHGGGDARSDLYTLGVLLWELVQQKRRFSGLNGDALQKQIVRAEVGAPSKAPPAFGEVVKKACARQPSDRYDDAAAMSAAIRAACPQVATHDEVAAFYDAILGKHPALQRVRRAVEEARATASGESQIMARAAVPAATSHVATEPDAQEPDATEPDAPAPDTPAPDATAPTPAAPKAAAPPPPPQRGLRFDPESPPPSAASGPSAITVPAKGSDRPVEVEIPPAPLPPDLMRLATGAQSDARSGESASLDSDPADTSDPPDDSLAPGDSIAPADSIHPPGPASEAPQLAHRQVGRCELFTEIAHGGMATVHLGRWVGAGGFNKSVAVKALHRQYARDAEFVRMFLDEARVVARIRHPNVMPIIDLVDDQGELFIIMEYMHGVTLAHLMRQMNRRKEKMPVGIALRILSGVLHGLHAAHEAKDSTGRPMNIIHRDISPENIMIGDDGYARIIDFGIASALGRASTTEDGHVKGKPSYLSPEQVLGDDLDRRTDIYAASVVLWQALTGRKLFTAENIGAMSFKIIQAEHPPPSKLRKGVSPELDGIVLKGMSHQPDGRYTDAALMAEALEKLPGVASHREVGQWVKEVAASRLGRAQKLLAAVESAPVADHGNELSASQPRVRMASEAFPRELGPDDLSGELSTSASIPKDEDWATGSGGRRGLLIGGAVIVAAIGIALAVWPSSEASPDPAASATSPPGVTPPPTGAPAPSVSATSPSPSAQPSVEASAQASAQPTSSAATTTAPSTRVAPPPRPPVGAPLPRPVPNPNPRLPSGI
ncbi:MAG: protein kinase, partial [Myxococcales bacterium]|nr:protein kinase [Myxococcales bacterium]